jgi:hypothetical protein
MRMADMKMSKKDRKENMPVARDVEEPPYPDGLKLRLDDDALKKLGITMPAMGDQFKIVGHGTVTSVSSHEGEGHKHRSVEIQIKKLALGKGKAA